MDKQIAVHLYNEILLNNRKECNSMNGFQNNYAEAQKRARSLCPILWTLVVLVPPSVELLDQKQSWLFFTAKVEFVIGKRRGIDLNLMTLKTSITTSRPDARDLGSRSEFASGLTAELPHHHQGTFLKIASWSLPGSVI